MDIQFVPLHGVIIGENQINFGMSKEQVSDILKIPCGDITYAFDNQLSIYFDENDRVCFIECLDGENKMVRPYIYGIDGFGTKAEKLMEILKEKNNGKIDDSEADYGYVYLNIGVSVYREISPADVNEMIEEAKECGTYEEDMEDLESERLLADYFATIGIGQKGYFEI